MSLEASTLAVVVKSDGINQTTDALNKLAVAGDKAERSTAKLAKSGAGLEASAKAQAKVWYDMLDKVAKAHEREYNALQRHNNRLYGLVQAQAIKMNKERDRWMAHDAANAARRRKQEQEQLEQLDILRRNAAAKEYARAQAEANKMNTMLERARKQNEAAAKAAAERQRVLNSNYATAGLAAQINTLERAQAYGASGGNVSNRFGSAVAGAMNSGELQRLTAQYRQLQGEARRANSAMADTHAAVRGLSGSLGALWLTYGNILPLVAGAAVGAAIKGIVDVGSDVEHTLEKIRVLGQASTAEIDKMRDVVFELGKGVQGPRDVAEAFSVLTLAGLKAEDALTGVGAALNLAVAGDISIEKSAQTLVQVSTSLGYTADGFNHVADVIAKTAAVSMSSVESISGAFLSAAAVGEVYGASLQDIAVGLAAVANLGIQGTAAGTTLKNFYKDLSSGGDKATKTLKDMGLTMRDLKDADGFFLSMDKLLPKLNDGFSRLNKLARPEAMDKIFGERGVKTGAALIAMVNQVSNEVDALGNKYANKFEEVFDQINKAAAFSTLSAIAMSQTTNNQLKSVGNTLQTVLGKAFADVAPQIGDVAREMKRAFNSPEFLSGVKSIATAVADLTKFIVTHIDVIGKLIAAYAGFKVMMFAAGLVEVAKGFTLASIGAKAFAVSLGPIAVAIAAMGAAWAIYKANKNDALNNNSAAASLSEYADGVVSAAQAEQEAIDMRKKSMSEIDVARKRQMDQDKEASRAAIRRSEQGLTAMRDEINAQYAALSENQKVRVKMVQEGKTQFADRQTVQFVDNLRNYNTELARHNNQVKVVTSATEELIKKRQINGKLQDEAAKQNRIKPTGDQDLTRAPEKNAKKMATFLQNEALELSKLTAGYEAKTAAMKASVEQGKLVAAETQQAIVLENLLAGKYGENRTDSNEIYQKQKLLAISADAAKLENQRWLKHHEFGAKLSELEAAQDAFNQAGLDGSNAHMGALRKEAEGIIRNTSLLGEQAEKLRKRADAMDEYKRQQEAVAKLESAVASTQERASAALEEAEAMAKYGEVTKLTATQVAELTIAKMRLNDVGSEGVKSMLREAAATEQLNTAYRNLMKQQVDINKKIEEAQAESKLIFADSEAEKVRIATETRKKLLALEYQKAKDAFDAKASSGKGTFEDFTAMAAAYNTYLRNIAKADELHVLDTNNLRLREWKKTVDDIEQIGREGFYNLTQKGVNFWSSMAKTFKSMFKTTVMDYIYKEFAKPFVLKVIAQFAGGMGMDGLAQAASGMGGGSAAAAGTAPSTASGVSSAFGLFKMLQGGFDKIGSMVTNAVDGIASQFGPGSIGAEGPGAFAKGAGQAASYASALYAGHTIGKTISGGYAAFGGSGNTAVNVATVAGAMIAGPVGAAIGGAIAGGINRLFGHKAKEVTKEGIRGTITGDGTAGESYSEWLKKGGVFRSDKRGTDTNTLTSDMVNSFTSGLNTLKASSTAFASNLGVSAEALTNYSKTFDITLTKDAAANEKAVTEFFVEMGDDMAKKLVPNIMEFAKQGETASGVLERLSATFDVTKNLANALGKSVLQMFGKDGLDSAAIRTKLVDLSGGVDALAQKTTAYMTAIYTDAQKLAPVQKALSDAMSSLGLSSITTKEQFKAVVDGLNLTSEADIKLFNSLMELAPAFAEVTDAAKNAADKLKEANKEIMDKAMGGAENALDALSRAIDNEKDSIDKKFEAAIDSVKRASEAAIDAAEKQREATEKQRDAIKTILSNIEAAMKSTEVESFALTKVRRAEAQAYLATAAIQARSGGSVTNMTGLTRSLENIAKPSEDLFSSFEEYARDQAFAANNIQSLNSSAKAELNYAELTIDRLNATIDTIQKSTDAQIAALEKTRDTEKEALDNILTNAQEQLDALKGIDNSIKGVIDALEGYNSAMAGVKATEIQQKTGNNGLAIESLYNNILGRSGDAAGMDYWKNAAAKGTSIADIASAIRNSPESQVKTLQSMYSNILGRASDPAGLDFWKSKLAQGTSLYEIEQAFRNSAEYKTQRGIPSFDVGTNFVTEDTLAMVHKGERIMPAADNSRIERAIRENSESSSELNDVKAELRELKQIMVANGVATVQAIKEGNKVLKKFDQEGLPETRDVTA